LIRQSRKEPSGVTPGRPLFIAPDYCYRIASWADVRASDERNLDRYSHSRGSGAVSFLGLCQVFRNQRSIEQSEEPRLFDPQPSHHHKAPIDALAMASRTSEAGMQPPSNSRVAGSIVMPSHIEIGKNWQHRPDSKNAVPSRKRAASLAACPAQFSERAAQDRLRDGRVFGKLPGRESRRQSDDTPPGFRLRSWGAPTWRRATRL
jgi:hypothetical protein